MELCAFSRRALDRLGTSFALVALAMVPMAVLGRVKQAGDVNSFSPALYPLLLALAARSVSAESTQAGLRLRASAVLTALCLAGTARLAEEVRILGKLRPVDAEASYLRRRPGEVYFPWHPGAHLAAEGRPTHHLFSAWERGEAGYPASRDQLLGAIPKDCQFVAFPLKRLGPVAGFGSDLIVLEALGLIDPRQRPVRLAGLPDYECYRVTR